MEKASGVHSLSREANMIVINGVQCEMTFFRPICKTAEQVVIILERHVSSAGITIAMNAEMALHSDYFHESL